MKKLTALLLSLCMIVGLWQFAPVRAEAEPNGTIAAGETLTVNATGYTEYEYTLDGVAPGMYALRVWADDPGDSVNGYINASNGYTLVYSMTYDSEDSKVFLAGDGYTVSFEAYPQNYDADVTVHILVDKIDDLPTVKENETTSFSFGVDEEAYYCFVPASSGYYRFLNTDNGNIWVELADTDNYGHEVYSSRDGENKFSSAIFSEVVAGEPYLLSIKSASYEAESGTFTIAPVTVATALTIEENPPVYIGESVYLELYPEGDNTFPGINVEWKSSNDDVAAINYSGYDYCSLNTIAEGTATITVTNEAGAKASTEVTVVKRPEADQIEFERNLYTGRAGDTGWVDYEIYPDDAEYQKYTWSSTDENIAYYDAENYQLVYKAPGNAVITLTGENGVQGSFKVLVQPVAEPFKLNVSSTELGYAGEDNILYPYFEPSDSATHTFTYKSSNEAVVKVDESGTLSFIAPGTAEVTVTADNGLSAVCRVMVKERPKATSLTLTESIQLPEGEWTYIEGIFLPTTAIGEIVKWESSDLSVATVKVAADSRGRIDAVKEGTTVITATSAEGFTASCTVTVTKGEDESYTGERRLIIEMDSIMYPHIASSYSVSIEPSGDYESVKWSSTDESVIRPDYYGFSVLKVGKTTLTATSTSGLTASVDIEVVEPEEIKLNEVKTFSQSRNKICVKFVPEEDGYYNFISKCPNGTASIYSFNGSYANLMNTGYYSDEAGQACAAARLSKGKTYFLANASYLSDKSKAVDYEVTVTKGKKLVDLNVTKNPDKIKYIKGEFDNSLIDYTGLEVEATWSDGTKDKWSYTKNGLYVDGRKADLYNTGYVQYDGLIIIDVDDVRAPLYFELTDNPVDHIEIINGPTVEYVYGDLDHGYISSYDKNYRFDTYNFTGLTYKVFYKDGSSKTFTFDYEDDARWYPDGYPLSISTYVNPAAPGKYTYFLTYLGQTVPFEVEIKETSVAKVEMTKLPASTTYRVGYSVDWIGAEITVTYKDGRTGKITLTDANSSYGSGYIFELNGEKGMIRTSGSKFTVAYMGQVYEGSGLTRETSPAINEITFDKFSTDGNFKYTVKYADGTSETITGTSVFFEPYKTSGGYSEYYGYTRTKYGQATFWISEREDSFYVDMLGKGTTVKRETSSKDLFETEPIVRSEGKLRFDTAISTADKLKSALGVAKFDTIIVASSHNFPDALAGSYLAAKKSAPVIIVRSTDQGLDQAVAYVKANLAQGGLVYILGGEAAVSANAAKQIKAAADTVKGTVERLAGANRYETNMLILKAAKVTSGEDLIIADASAFADALSASALGKPLLLINKKTGKLNDAQKQFVSETSFNRIYILGGKNAVPESIEKELASLKHGTDIKRLGGATRYETSALIAKEFFGNTDCVTLATGANFPDGLTGGPLAFALGAPLVLTRAKDADIKTAAGFISESGATKAIVFGGSAALSADTVTSVMGR